MALPGFFDPPLSGSPAHIQSVASPQTIMVEGLIAARDMPDGDEKNSKLERIAAYADAAGDVRLGVRTRLSLIEAYQHHNEHWRLHEPVRWCLAAVARTPKLFDQATRELLRRHQRDAVGALLGTPRLGLDQARSSVNDLTAWVLTSGQSMGIIYQLRCRIADHLGDEPTSRDWFTRWRDVMANNESHQRLAVDAVEDCRGCGVTRQAELLAGWGEWDAALAAAQPVFDGVVDCTEQPERALAAIMLPLLHLGRSAEAEQAHLRAYRRHRREHVAFPYLAAHLWFCALGGHLARGLAILAEQLPRLDRPLDEMSAMEFAAAGALLCRLADGVGLGEGHGIHRPPRGERVDAQVTVAELGRQLLAAATDLSGRFDARNGTGHQSGRVASWLSWRPLTISTPLPLPADDAE